MPLKLSKTEIASLIGRQQHSQLMNMMHGTPVQSMESILAQQQDKARQMMVHQRQQKNGYVPSINF